MACSSVKTVQMQFAPNPVVAHRGAFKAMKLPENSVAAMQQAVAMGCAGTEFDVWLTADDSLVLNHDPHYKGQLIEKNEYANLAAKTLANGEVLPTLRNALLAGMHNNKQTRLILEIKPSQINKERGELVARKVVTLVQSIQAEKYLTYISFDYGILKAILQADKNASTQYLAGDKSPAELKADGIAGLDYHYSVFKKHPEWIAEAKQLQLKLNAWTVNDAADMRWLLDNGFDFITTNEPELLFQLWKERKQ